jgi:hypothetical protein
MGQYEKALKGTEEQTFSLLPKTANHAPALVLSSELTHFSSQAILAAC